MICPRCRLYISNPNTDFCPRCAQPLSSQSAYTPGSEQLGSSYQPTVFSPPPSPDPYAGFGSQPYGGPPAGNPYPGGQQYPPGYSGPSFQPPFPPPASPYGSPMMPLPAPPRPARRALLIGGILLVVVLVACVGGAYLLQKNRAGLATATPFPGTTPGATIIYQDALTSPSSGWSNDNSHCFFQDGAYHIKDGYVCYSPAGNIGDGQITVQTKQLAGSTMVGYGIALRRTSAGNFYEFEIDGDSVWRFAKFVNNQFSDITKAVSSPAINGGLNTINSLSVIAQGSHFVFFINGTQVGEADDTTFSTGKAGLRVGDEGVEVAFNYFQVTAVS